MKSKQYIVIGLVAILMVGLYSLDIKGLVKQEGEGENAEMQSATTAKTQGDATIDEATVTAVSKQMISASLAADIEKLEKEVKSADGAKKVELQKQLAFLHPAAAAFSYEEVAKAEANYENWLIAGDRFTEGYQNNTDSTVTAGLVNRAINAYNKALAFNADGLDAKTGLGVAYVSGTQNPMQGIQLLLGVVKEDPKNEKANMNLGMFSMKSGQFQKAIDRFKTVIAVKPTPEAWFYLATSYENLGQKPEAILAYQKSKELAADPSLTGFVDRKIKELSN